MYSNSGFILLGAIIEKVTGKSYAQNVEEKIVNPLGLNDIVLTNVGDIKNRAVGYMKTVDGVVDNEDFLPEPLPDGGFYATAKSVMKFYRAYFSISSCQNKKFKKIFRVYTKQGHCKNNTFISSKFTKIHFKAL